jgi:prenyltransferase beta subunit
MYDSASCSLRRLSVQFLRAAVAVLDGSIHIADKNGVMRESQRVRQLAQGGFGLLLGMQAHSANAFCILSSNRAQQAVLVIRRHDQLRRFSDLDRWQT